MFKNLSHLNKQTTIAIVLVIGLLLMLFINLFVLIPQLIGVYSATPTPSKAAPIDTVTVNNAIELLEKGP